MIELLVVIAIIAILIALLVQKGVRARAFDTGTTTWEAAKEYRAVPSELRNLREVRIARRVLPISSIWDETQRHTVNGSRPMSSSSKPKWEWSGWSCPRLAKIMTGRWG